MNRAINYLKPRQTWQLHFMMLPVVVIVFIFSYIPMVGLSIVFQDYLPTKGFFGSPWVGLDNLKFLFSLQDFSLILRNTLVISISKLVVGMCVSVFFAVMLSESNIWGMKNIVQTLVFFPFFISWVVLGGVFLDLFSLGGAINQILGLFKIEPVMFLGNPTWFVIVSVVVDTWKGFGYNMIVFYAAIMGIDAALYESATLDGAGKVRQVFAITIPSIAPMIAVMGILALGGVLNAGFDQIFNMYNPLVYKTADILDTYIFRMGIVSGQYSFSAAVGFFKSVISMVLIITGNWLARRYAGYMIF
jgi:putative aldouronate transport system permease protein